MIKQVIENIKLSAAFKIHKEKNRVLAAHSIENLIAQIDLNSEVIPISDIEKLIKLFSSLKKGKLTAREIEVIIEISETKIPIT